MTKLVHPVAGAIALIVVATFWLSTLAAEILGSEAAVVAVKTAVPWGLLLLIPSMATAGGSGVMLAGGATRGLIGVKRRRMAIAAANGLLILVPAALFLASRARAGTLDATFYIVQAIELIAGATNVTLLTLNMQDGFKLAARIKTAPAK